MNMIAGIMEHFHNGMPFVVGIFILYIVNFIAVSQNSQEEGTRE
jgi:hypothetical protein